MDNGFSIADGHAYVPFSIPEHLIFSVMTSLPFRQTPPVCVVRQSVEVELIKYYCH